jgi:prephenate dehydrogenase
VTAPRALVLGVGLIGGSVALALREAGYDVAIRDAGEVNQSLAVLLGCGLPWDGSPVDIAVVAVPPAAVGEVAARLLEDEVATAVTDVASIKTRTVADVEARLGSAAARFVGGHPLAGSERSGPTAARADLFQGRPWVITDRPGLDPEAVRLVEQLVADLGAVPVRMTPEEHDAAVAAVSHLPHVVSALLAKQLGQVPDAHLAIAGTGLRDTTRIAAGDPTLWREILGGNARHVARMLRSFADDVTRMVDALDATATVDALGRLPSSRPGPDPTQERPWTADPVAAMLEAGRAGRSRVPIKRGRTVVWAVVGVVVHDRPGELARLFADVERAVVNVEDVIIDHPPGRPLGVVELEVDPAEAARLVAALTADGWAAHLGRADPA